MNLYASYGLTLALASLSAAAAELRNDRYALDVQDDGAVALRVEGMAPQLIAPEFTVLRSPGDPQLHRNFNHPNYPVAPRPAVRWLAGNEPADALNAWLATPAMKAAVQWDAKVTGEGDARVWEYRDKSGQVALRVGGRGRDGATRPFAVGEKTISRATKAEVSGDTVRWKFAANENFALEAAMRLPGGEADPELSFTLKPKHSGYYSVAFTGAPAVPRTSVLKVPQECAGRGFAQGDFVFSEADLKLPRVVTVTREGSFALVADPRECRFRLPTIEDSRFGLMRHFTDGDNVRPVLLAPLLGGAESKMKAGVAWSFTLRIAARTGNWMAMQRHIAQDIHGLRNQRDNSGPGSMNGCIERVMGFLANRNGRNHAMWSEEQKYYDYFTDQTGVFKPFSSLYGLSAAIVTDDEAFYRERALPAVEFALSRKYNLFAPYEGIYEAIVKSAQSEVGGPYPGYAQLLSLDRLLRGRSPVIRKLAETQGASSTSIADHLARWRKTGDRRETEAALKLAAKAGSSDSEQGFFDLIELYDATHDARVRRALTEAAYRRTTDLNLYPAAPNLCVTVDAGGVAPVHKHSFGRHANIWGFQTPQPVPAPEQTVPAWRVSRLGLPSPAYPMEFWMNTHGALLRTAALTGDDFLRDIARNGMVGRFGNYPGDNRSQVSLINERPDAVEAPPWRWNFATVNPGHAWDFVAQLLDYLVAEAFLRSKGEIEFPAVSAAGSAFRVRIYSAGAGTFHGAKDAHLWLPRGLLECDSPQIDWLAARGSDQLYLALMNQSAHEETVAIRINSDLAECRDGASRAWRNNEIVDAIVCRGNELRVTIPAKGMLALALPAKIRAGLQAKLDDDSTRKLGPGSHIEAGTPFGKIHAMLLSAGRGLTSAFVYSEAPPSHVIAARLRWRQGGGDWQERVDTIFPYEFSTELGDNGGDFQCVLEIENERQQLERSPLITLHLSGGQPASTSEPPPGTSTWILPQPAPLAHAPQIAIRDDFLDYLQKGTNPKQLGLRSGHFYPYSTPAGRRIGYGQPVWDKALFEKGCTPEEAEQHLRAEITRARAELARAVANFESLDARQQETLIDFALSEGADKLKDAFLKAVLARDWNRLLSEHLYVRNSGPAPDHARNKAFAQRWRRE